MSSPDKMQNNFFSKNKSCGEFEGLIISNHQKKKKKKVLGKLERGCTCRILPQILST